ncbi:MAG: acyl-CoA dehydrogenase family protein [Panacagrimonas sp.]
MGPFASRAALRSASAAISSTPLEVSFPRSRTKETNRRTSWRHLCVAARHGSRGGPGRPWRRVGAAIQLGLRTEPWAHWSHSTEDRGSLQDAARRFARAELPGLAQELEESGGASPRSMLERYGELGFLGINIDTRYGGMELGNPVHLGNRS